MHLVADGDVFLAELDQFRKFGAVGAVLVAQGDHLAVGQRNEGLDFQGTSGDPVRAAGDGKVIYAGDKLPGFGNIVLLQHDDDWASVYAHLGRLDVKNNDRVTQGQQIGQMGGAEPMHFEIRYRAKTVDPKLALPPRP